MRNLFIGLFFLFGSKLIAQVPAGVPQLFGGKYYQFKGYVLIDSLLLMPCADTNFIPIKPALVYKCSDSTFYLWTLTRWRAVLVDGDASSISANEGLSINAGAAQLGQARDAVADPAAISDDRVVPMLNGSYIWLKNQIDNVHTLLSGNDISVNDSANATYLKISANGLRSTGTNNGLDLFAEGTSQYSVGIGTFNNPVIDSRITLSVEESWNAPDINPTVVRISAQQMQPPGPWAKYLNIENGVTGDRVFSVMADGKVRMTTPVGGPASHILLWDEADSTIKKTTNTDLRGYKAYVALVSQTGTNDPVAIVLENTLGETITLTRLGLGGTGRYFITASGNIFDSNKTAVFLGSNENSADGVTPVIKIRFNTPSELTLTTFLDAVLSDGVLSLTAIEIRIYP
jgi:hypothetical protein